MSEPDWEWLKWLPHHQHPRLADALGPARMTYHSLGEASVGCSPTDDDEPLHTVIVVDTGATRAIEQPYTAGPSLQLRLDGDTCPDRLTLAQASVWRDGWPLTCPSQPT